ncbi:vWA domain-containing protein [Jeotgalibacillus proteolyticus]|nr:VWA domain-containing protein [Jeotgalibacillus proteolyticus]
MRKARGLLIALLSIALVACQNDEAQQNPEAPEEQDTPAEEPESDGTSDDVAEEDSNQEDIVTLVEQMNLDAPPETVQEVINQEVGSLNGINLHHLDRDESHKLLIEEYGDFPRLPEEPTEEELDAYFTYLYSLVKNSFPDPKDVLDFLTFELSGTPEADPRYSFKENYNIEVILDASGSMAAYAGEETRMELAKREITSFLSSVPEEANVSLRVYGHEGTGSDEDKEKSCSVIEEVYERSSYDEAEFANALDRFEPAGWTPVAGALESAKESFEGLDGEENTNLIYLVSDGIETCDGDPVAVAKSFAESNISPIINVIGFNADADAQRQLQEVAKEANGMFSNVNNADELKEEFNHSDEVLKRWEQWKRDADKEITRDSIDSSKAITKFYNQWSSASTNLNLNLGRALDYLENEEIITYDHKMALRDRQRELEPITSGIRNDLRDELKEAQKEGLDSMRQKLEERYPDEE